MLGFTQSKFFRLYIIPGAVFQSIMVGGGYGTGREVIEYFTSYGFLGGILGLLVAFAALSVIIALTFEFSRLYQVYDYRNFFKKLLGKGWVAFEILIILTFLLALAVLTFASGKILNDNFGLHALVGPVVMMTIVGTLTYFGRDLIAKVLTYWSFLLYAVFLAFFFAVLSDGTPKIIEQLGRAEVLDGWWISGLKYALYNSAIAPLILYVAREFNHRSEAIKSGVIAAAVAIFPALLFQVIFFAAYPEILNEDIPTYWMMAKGGMTILLFLYTIMLFGTFIETGAGMLQGINERIDGYLLETNGKTLSHASRAAIAVFAVIISVILSFWGIINLIGQGYGTVAWGFLAVYVIPLVTIGLFRILKSDR